MSTQDTNTTQAQNPFALAPVSGGALSNVLQNKAIMETLGQIMIAKAYPRDMNQVTIKIQQLCSRLSLANVAKYSYVKGGTRIEGESIHLANAILSAWGNIEAGWNEIERGFDAKKGCGYSECAAFCYDKETNYRKEIRFRVPHWRDTKAGGYVITDERDIYELCANMASRRQRACIFQVVPDFVRQEASELVDKTLEKGDGKPIDDRRRSMIAAFVNDFGITQEQIEKRVGHNASSISLTELVTLGKVYTAIRDGVTTPEAEFPVEEPKKTEPKFKKKEEEQPPSPPAAEPHHPKTEYVNELTVLADEAGISKEELDLAVNYFRLKDWRIEANAKKMINEWNDVVKFVEGLRGGQQA